jgi:hypothetical protein
MEQTTTKTDTLFTETNILMLFGFLATFSILGAVTGNNAIFDIIVLSSIVLAAFYILFNDTNEKGKALAELRRELEDFNTIFYVGAGLLILHLFMIIISKIGSSPFSLGLLVSFGWIYIAILLLVNFVTRVFKIPIVDFIFSDIAKLTPIDEINPEEVKPVSVDEVFNISNNLYTYEDAQNICSAYGAKLATYDEIEDAYNKGAEWCNYGWSESQMAYFPTQKSTWNTLQKSERHKNNCGRPGVNGGYMANPNIKFGVNCFGKKPVASDSDKARLNAQQTQLAPLTPEEALINEKVKYWKDNADKLLVVNSYNRKKWSEY